MRLREIFAPGVRAAGLVLLLALAACVPYPLSRTPAPVPDGEVETRHVPYLAVGGVERPTYDEDDPDATESLNYLALDWELRYGVDERADVGLRVASLSGFVVDYKRLLTPTGGSRPATEVAWGLGAGVVNLGQHGMAEASLLFGARGPADVRPYGALRIMQTVPLSSVALDDDPSVGAIAGVRLEFDGMTFWPELALYWDRSTTGVRESDWLLIPSLAFDLGGVLPGLARPVRTR